MRIGAHVSSAGGCQTVFARAEAIGAEAIQLFLSAPQQWKTPNITPEQEEGFRTGLAAAGVPVFIHGIYLANLATKDEAILEKSVTTLSNALSWAGRLGAEGVIFHVGSHLGAGFDDVLPQVCSLLRQILEAAPGSAQLLLETNAGQGACVGRTFGELAAMINGTAGDSRLGICIDTCHVYAMGYDIASREGCELTMAEFQRELGLDRLRAVHANDSKMPLGAVRDRHENIGDGHIGTEGFRTLMAHPASANVPFLLEVPGLDNKGPDKANVDRLKAIRTELGLGI